jgi:hypothetical protein
LYFWLWQTLLFFASANNFSGNERVAANTKPMKVILQQHVSSIRQLKTNYLLMKIADQTQDNPIY